MIYYAHLHVASRPLKPLPQSWLAHLFILLLRPLYSNAIPLHAPQSDGVLLEARQDFNGGNDSSGGREGEGLSIVIWAPILLLALLTLAIVGVYIFRRRRARAAAARAPATQNTTEVTADQLAGSTTNTSGATGTTANTRPRRARRARRASQMSVTSLPEYMKEPGDQELVIIRGRETLDEDDETRPNLVMPDGSLAPQHSRNDSEYSDIPETPHDMPLLQTDDRDPFRTPSRNTGTRSRRVSSETLPSAEDSPPQVRNPAGSQPTVDPRGEAPPYFEVVDLSESVSPPPQRPAQAPADTSTTSADSAASSSVPDSPTPARRSVLRSIFSSRMSFTGSPTTSANPPAVPPPAPPLPTDRPETPASYLSHSRDGSRSRASSHRPSHSASGSLLNLTPFRTISRQKSISSMNNHLSSPSMISLNSISSPLTHTVTRTEFTYPKSGPTPQQLKLISSREAFTKFGVPYGDDAIAYAANSSRQELEPPPGFEEVAGPSNRPNPDSSSASSSSGSSEVPESAQQQADALESSSQSPPTSGSAPVSTTEARPDGRVESGDQPESAAKPNSQPQPSTSNNGRSEPTVVIDSSASSSAVNPAAPSQAASSSELQSNSDTATDHGFSTAPASVSVIPPTPLLETKQLAQNTPPTSFRFPAEPSRPESRASMTSFETAAETIGAESSDSDDDDDVSRGGRATPPTPRLQPTHTLEPTDATITPRSRGQGR